MNDDKELEAKVAALPKDNMEEAIKAGIALAAEHGYEFTAEEWDAFNAAEEERPLSDSELDLVAGGGNKTTTDCIM